MWTFAAFWICTDRKLKFIARNFCIYQKQGIIIAIYPTRFLACGDPGVEEG